MDEPEKNWQATHTRLSGDLHGVGVDVNEPVEVSLTLKNGGPQIGTAVLHPGGFITADVCDPAIADRISSNDLNRFSIGIAREPDTTVTLSETE